MTTQSAGRLLSRVVGAVVGAIALVFALIFSVALFVVLAVVGLGVFGYVWWKTRALRRRMAEQQPGGGRPREGGGRIIDSTEIYEVREVRLEDKSNTTR